jgi:hypothetical protein
MEAVPWFETPRTRLRNLANSMLAAPHHEAGRDRGCIKLIGIRSRRRVAIRCEPTLSALRAGRVEPVALPSRIISRCTVLSSAATSRCVAASAQPGCSGALFDVLMEDRRREIIENKRSSSQNRSAGAADRLILTAPTACSLSGPLNSRRCRSDSNRAFSCGSRALAPWGVLERRQLP